MEDKQNEKIKLEFSVLTLWKTISGVLAILLIISIYTEGFGIYSDDTANVQQPQQAQPDGPVIVKAVDLDDNDPVMGKNDAKIEIIEFSDYQCPFCARFYRDTLPQIKENYINNGKAKLIFKDFPLDQACNPSINQVFHPEACKAAESALCVKEKGGVEGYFKMHDKIFENQQSINTENYKKWAKELGYNIDSCLDSGKYTKEVTKDVEAGIKASGGGLGTPSFFIGTKEDGYIMVSGAQPYQVFDQVLKSLK